MGLLERYHLYNSEGKKMFTVIPGKDTNTLLGMPQTAFEQFCSDRGLSIEE